MGGLLRINAFVSKCGKASRRRADELVATGRVTINGTPAKLGSRVDPAEDEVALDGTVIVPVGVSTTILLNKPVGYLVSRSDPHHSRTVYDLLPADMHHLVPVGRLDLDTEGALLLSNDGGLVHEITHPKHMVPKVYRATVSGHPDDEALATLRQGVIIDGTTTAPATIRAMGGVEGTTELEIVLREGRKRQVRRMCEAVGHRVSALKREAIGELALGELPSGAWRELDESDVAKVRGRNTVN
jgi:23S rRNA pseudouridine2605 synthase